MNFLADLHIHSKYSRATSSEMSPENLWKWAQFKGITVLGTGDFTHPVWMRELREKTLPEGNGLRTLKKKYRTGGICGSCKSEVFFMLTAEISCIFRRGEKTRKVHSLVLAPDFASAEKINSVLSKKGNLNSDGRPILGLDVKELAKIVLSVPDTMLIPAHAWTPHFSVFGAASGFDSLEECFEELTPHIHAIETGLSSDPPMNWRLSSLDGISLVSNSDAHSPWNIGREANIFDTLISYRAMTDAIRTKEGFKGTVEFFPEEGKYHHDGHRTCGIGLTPRQSMRHNYLCPACGKKLTIGVLHRVEKLADRKEGYRPPGAAPYSSVIPLRGLLSETLGAGPLSKKVQDVYFDLIRALGNEMKILRDASPEEIESEAPPLVAEAISRMRSGRVNIAPGFDGEYGKIRIFSKPEGHFCKIVSKPLR